MKPIKLILLMIIGITSLSAQEEYPSRDSKEWNDLTVAQRWQAVNIPDDQLSKMHTNELIEHCINFDFMWDIFNHPNYGSGLNVVIENHNGLRELLGRNDAGKLIFDYYNKIDLNKITEISEPANRGKYAAKVFFLELFLSHHNILNQFRGNEKELIKGILRSYDFCLDINAKTEKNLYSGYSIDTKTLAIGRMLDNLKGRQSTNPAIEEMNLGKLSREENKRIIEEARKL